MTGVKSLWSWLFLGLACVVAAVLTYLWATGTVSAPHFQPPHPEQYPISNITQNFKGVEIQHRVVATEDGFSYEYTLTHHGSGEILFSWHLLDRITNAKLLLLLHPNQPRTISFKSTSKPYLDQDLATIFVPTDAGWVADAQGVQQGPMPMPAANEADEPPTPQPPPAVQMPVQPTDPPLPQLPPVKDPGKIDKPSVPLIFKPVSEKPPEKPVAEKTREKK